MAIRPYYKNNSVFLTIVYLWRYKQRLSTFIIYKSILSSKRKCALRFLLILCITFNRNIMMFGIKIESNLCSIVCALTVHSIDSKIVYIIKEVFEIRDRYVLSKWKNKKVHTFFWNWVYLQIVSIYMQVM